MMSTALALPVAEPDADEKGLAQHVGSSMKPGARLEIWFFWEKVGELECKSLTETRIEFHAKGRLLGRTFDTAGKIELGPQGRCTIELGELRDPEACYCLEHKRPFLISEDFDGHAPSLRFWADAAETRAELRCYVGIFRPRIPLTLAPPKLAALASSPEQ
jgi:hypothetical protein